MSNKNVPLPGYKALTDEQVELIRQIRAQGAELEQLVMKLDEDKTVVCDNRWLSVGTTNLQFGLMALTRAVAQPEFF